MKGRELYLFCFVVGFCCALLSYTITQLRALKTEEVPEGCKYYNICLFLEE